ncbi:ATP-binding protein [Ramlibacter sp. WS9]|uniref:hybrid sensor histidine kinase/response regulator n=1 Tax=Ramlibacter sp. WS9 TaxID=1882741 RepID=UPI00130542B3|nr:ATP-binding protein [Ramlibacter sp. WS9]
MPPDRLACSSTCYKNGSAGGVGEHANCWASWCMRCPATHDLCDPHCGVSRTLSPPLPESPVPSLPIAALNFHAVFDAAPAPYLILGTDLSIVDVNQAYLRATQTRREEIIGRSMLDVFPDNPEGPAANGMADLRASLVRVLETKAADRLNTPVLDATGRVTHIIHRAEDVTIEEKLRILAEAALRASEERYRSLFSSIDEGFCIIEVLFDERRRPQDYRFCEVNPSFEQQTGLVDAKGKTMRELAPAHEAHWFEIYGRVAETGESIRFENEAKALNRWFDVFAFRMQEEDGPRVAVLFKDITERKRLSETLRRSEHAATEAARRAEAERQRLDAVLQAAPVGIVVSEANGAILLSNAAHRRLWGAHPDPWNVDQFRQWKGWWADHSERHGRPLGAREWTTARILSGEENPRDIVTIESFDVPPVRRTVLMTGAPIKDGQGGIVGAVVAQMDISDRIKSEEALLQADRRKDEFLAMLAHELRNPLAPIAAAADLLGMGRLDDTQIGQTSNVIRRQVKHMTGLVDDLLDVSRVTRGLVQLDKARLDAKRILFEAVEQVRPLIEARRHRLAVHTPPESTFVLGDVKRLVQVVANLLNNAAKYTPPGGDIALSMEAEAGQIKIAVSDNGVGMAPELQDRAFELFAQAARSPDRSQGGLGIGLALVKSLVALHGGSIAVHSAGVGQGSRFEVCLPHLTEEVPWSSAQAHAGNVDAPGSALNLMVVDDNVDAAKMLAMLLGTWGHRVFVEHDPQRALDRARVEKPDVCLLDIGLPGMDGNELARRLRSQPETAQTVLIAVTGYGQEQDREAALAAGFDHHVAKPVDSATLIRLLDVAQSRTSTPARP